MKTVSIFVPGSIGNVGPGFDILGLAVDGLGDVVSLALTDGPAAISSIRGRDATLIPTSPDKNCAITAAKSYLRRSVISQNPVVGFDRKLPLSGGLGSSAAASVAGAFAAAIASGDLAGPTIANAQPEVVERILEAALDGEESVAGRHLDNIAPCLFGGLCLARTITPTDVIQLKIDGSWWITVVSPDLKLPTKDARAVLPKTVDRQLMLAKMANTCGVIAAFASANGDLMRRSLHDLFAEPWRRPLIQHFDRVKQAALNSGAFGCSISGAGPTLFAITKDPSLAQAAGDAMQRAFLPIASSIHVGLVAAQGARVVTGAPS